MNIVVIDFMDNIYFYDLIKNDLANIINNTLLKLYNSSIINFEEIKNSFEISKFSDLSCSIAFKISDKLNKKENPNSIALKLRENLGQFPFLSSIEIKNGFLNFYFNRSVFSNNIIKHILNNYNLDNINSNHTSKNIIFNFLIFDNKHKKIIVEYPSVNPNKPWHLGHLRNALLGDVISNIFAFNGYDIERQDYIDDFGLQAVESLWGYLHLNSNVNKKFDQWLGEEYVKVNEYMSKNDIKQDLDILMHLIEQDGTYEANLAKKLATQCVLAQYETAFSYNIYHDVLIYESSIVKTELLKKSIEILAESKFVTKPESGKYSNCVIIDFEKIENLPNELKEMEEKAKVLIRSNGTATYLAKDIAFHMWKLGLINNIFKYKKIIDQPNSKPLFSSSYYSSDGESKDFGNADKVINIIDTRQSYLQTLIKLAFISINKHELADSLKHLSYGEVVLEAGVLSGRQGTWIGYTADLLLEQAIQKAKGLVKSEFNLTEQDFKNISKIIALSAIKFEFLKQSPEKKIVFSWDSALNFNANSGPYAQYTFARASRIIEKSRENKININKIDFSYELNDIEFELIKSMSKIRNIIEKSSLEYRPNLIIEYTNELCILFTRFYENIKILDVDLKKDNLYYSRLGIIFSFKYILEILFSIIGIEPLEKM